MANLAFAYADGTDNFIKNLSPGFTEPFDCKVNAAILGSMTDIFISSVDSQNPLLPITFTILSDEMESIRIRFSFN